jgi:CRP-like cAMP-binding protein
MSSINQSAVENRLLKALAPEEFNRFAPHLQMIELPIKHVLVEVDQPTTHVCFLESGLGSMVATSSDDETVEVGHIGREGMTGEHIVMTTGQTPNKTFMQVPGTGYLMPASALVNILNESVPARQLLLRYVHSCALQLSHSALANGRYSINERLARWLLMVHDRVEGDDLPLTHEFLGLMLGVRRSGVTDQIHLLEGIHAIKATRGNIRVLDREKLMESAGGCYGVPEREYERLIGMPISANRRE